jgi:hypothetical protein
MEGYALLAIGYLRGRGVFALDPSRGKLRHILTRKGFRPQPAATNLSRTSATPPEF